MSKKCQDRSKIEYFIYHKRSLNVCYSHDLLDKRKYNNIRKANRVPNIPNFGPYKQLPDHIRSVDIGNVKDINPIFTEGLSEEEQSEEMF